MTWYMAHQPKFDRPISIAPVISKIMEKEVHHQVCYFLVEHHLIYSSQHGFRLIRST